MIDEEIFDIKKRFDGKFGNVTILDRKVIDIDKQSKGFLEDELL